MANIARGFARSKAFPDTGNRPIFGYAVMVAGTSNPMVLLRSWSILNDFEVRPISDACGAKVLDVDRSTPLRNEKFVHIYRAVMVH